MKQHLPVDVEPLSESRWSRIERETFNRLDSRRSSRRASRGADWQRLALAGGGVVAVAGLALALIFARGPMAKQGGDRLRLATTDSASQFSLGDSSLTVAPRSLVLV